MAYYTISRIIQGPSSFNLDDKAELWLTLVSSHLSSHHAFRYRTRPSAASHVPPPPRARQERASLSSFLPELILFP